MRPTLLLIVILSLVTTLDSAFGKIGRDMVKESRIEQELNAINPALVEPFRQARIAMDKQDAATSVRLLQGVCIAAPGFDAAQRRLGMGLAQTGQLAEGIAHVEKALALKRSAANLASLAAALTSSRVKEGPATQAQQQRAFSLLKEAAAMPEGRDAGNFIQLGSIAFNMNDRQTAREATEALQRLEPDLMETHYFAAILAASNEQWILAKREILKAQELGLPSVSVRHFLDSGVGLNAAIAQFTGIAGWAAAVWAVGILALFGFGFALSKTTLRQIEKSDPNVPINPKEQRLRRVYRGLLNVAGVYYYISLPVVLMLVIGLTGGIIYFFLCVGTIPIKLVAILMIGAVMTIWSMLRSIFMRIPSSDPGRVLERSEAEGLWRLAEEVAAELKTRPIDEIRITRGTDLCVYERGSWREKLQNRAKRVMVLGMALVPEFRQEDFRCVLAHEYGHFAHRDTAGGDVAMRVQLDMIKFYHAMLAAGQARKFNVAFQFLRLYDFIFRRISHGATRLQEVLADRIAAQVYGADAFEGGLTHVIRRGIAFDHRVNHEIKHAIESARPILNLYALQPVDAATEEQDFQMSINRPTTDDDTHPGPKDRFRFIAGLTAQNPLPSTELVSALFRDPEIIMSEMVAEIEKQVALHRKAR